MELIKNFGLNPLLLGAQIINFLIVFAFLKRFLYKPVLDVLKKRRALILEGVKNAEEAAALLKKTKEEEQQILIHAHAQGSKLIEEAKSQTATIIKQAEELARKQEERILKETKNQIQQEVKEVEARLTGNTSRLAVQFLEKALKELFAEKEQKELLKNALMRIKNIP